MERFPGLLTEVDEDGFELAKDALSSDRHEEDLDSARRRFLGNSAKYGALGVLGWQTLKTAPSVYEDIEFLDRVDTRNFNMVNQASEFLLSDTEINDWVYNHEHVFHGIEEFLNGFSSGEDFGGIMKYCPEEATISTPDDGITANFTPEGRLSTMMFPHTGFTHQIPYYVRNDKKPLRGAKPREGSFGGLKHGDDIEWLWQDSFNQELEYLDGSGIIEIEYEGSIDVEERSYVVPGTETIARDFILKNNSEEPTEGSFVYSTQANINDNQQNFGVWASNQNSLNASEDLIWQDLDGPYEMMIHSDSEISNSGAVNTDPEYDLKDEVAEKVETIQDRIRASASKKLQKSIKDNSSVSELEKPDIEASETELDEIFEEAADKAFGNYLTGFLEVDYDLDPGEEKRLSFFITGGEDTEKIDTACQKVRQEKVENYWSQRVDEMELPTDLDTHEEETAVRAAESLLMLTDPETKAIIASPNLQPNYSFSWPRDGSISAEKLAELGFHDEAEAYLSEYLPEVMEEDGSFYQTYDAKGDYSGIFRVENDQQPIYISKIRRVHEKTGNDEFLQKSWEAVRKAADYTVESIVDNGLLAATPDYAEQPTDIRQSLWTNAWAYRGLKDAAEMAEKTGKTDLAKKYSVKADQIGEATTKIFVENAQEEKLDYATLLDWEGLTQKINRQLGFVARPTSWAKSHEVLDNFTEDWPEITDEVGWAPGSFTHVEAMYRNEMDSLAQDSLQLLEDKLVSEVGPVGERYEDERLRDAMPLAWAQAAYLDALESKYE